MPIRALAALTGAIVVGCATAPTDSSGRPLTIADAGPPPASPEAAMRAALRQRLKDPDTAMVTMVGKPKPMVVKAMPGYINGGAGWRLCAEVNAKNSYGGYTGYRRIFVLWHEGRVVNFFDGDEGAIACRGVESEP